MGVLGRFEKGIERAVNGAFAKAFRSEVQPVEIASALRRECDDKAAIVGRDRTVAPNTFVVELGTADHDRLGEWETALGDELSAAIRDHAQQQRYGFVGPVNVTFEKATDLDTGVFRVRSQTARPEDIAPGRSRPASNLLGEDPSRLGRRPQADPLGAPAPQVSALPPAAFPPPAVAPPAAPDPLGAPPAYDPQGYNQQPAYNPPAYSPQPAYNPPAYSPPGGQPGYDLPGYSSPSYGPPSGPVGSPYSPPTATVATLEVDGRVYRLTNTVTVIGRSTDVDVVLDDPGVSRRHAEVHLVDGRARVIDLGSTNGTFVDGERVHAGTLADGSTVTIGRSRITFRAGQW